MLNEVGIVKVIAWRDGITYSGLPAILKTGRSCITVGPCQLSSCLPRQQSARAAKISWKVYHLDFVVSLGRVANIGRQKNILWYLPSLAAPIVEVLLRPLLYPPILYEKFLYRRINHTDTLRETFSLSPRVDVTTLLSDFSIYRGCSTGGSRSHH